jgi:hypothetical protein
MKHTIDYNIARHRPLRTGCVLTWSGVFALLALTLAAAGLLYLAHARHIWATQAAALESLRTRIAQYQQRADSYKAAIAQQKTQWQPQVGLANQIIAQKAYSFIDRLDFFEGLLPEGVQLRNLTLGNGQSKSFIFTITAADATHLFAFYKALAAYRFTVQTESENPEGTFIATIQLTVPHD